MRIKKFVTAIVLASVLFSTALLEAVHAGTPYEAYNYNYWEEAVASPAAFVPSRAVSGQDLGIGPFVEPNDMVIGHDGSMSATAAAAPRHAQFLHMIIWFGGKNASFSAARYR